MIDGGVSDPTLLRNAISTSASANPELCSLIYVPLDEVHGAGLGLGTKCSREGRSVSLAKKKKSDRPRYMKVLPLHMKMPALGPHVEVAFLKRNRDAMLLHPG